MRSLQHTWQCAVSHMFNSCGDNVNFICSLTDQCYMDNVIVDRRRNLLRNLGKLHYQHLILPLFGEIKKDLFIYIYIYL